MTQRLKTRLAVPTQNEDASQKLLNASHSGDVLTGTHSDLSTIHTASMLMNTRDSSEPNPYVFSFEVGTSQESARSGTINNSSGMDNETDSGRVNKDTGSSRSHGLVDSGIFSAKNYSETSAEAAKPCQSSDRNGSMAAAVDGPTSLPLDAVSAGALEARFLTLAATDVQTLQSTVDNSESCGNSHGFVPRGQRSTMTESSSRKLDHVTSGSNDNSSGGAESGSKMVESNSGSGSARSQEKIVEEKVEMEGYVSSNEEDEEEEIRNGGYGNFHRYRQMLDEKESDTDGDDDGDEEEGEVVEIVPRNLNNISMVLALGDVMGSEAGQVQGVSVLGADVDNKRDVARMMQDPDSLKASPASPNVNLLEGTSVWCSEDNDESFFLQVFERNTHLLVQNGEHVDEKTLNAWFQDQSPNASKARLESWLEGHHRMETSNRPAADNGRYNEFVLSCHEDDEVSQCNEHSEDKDNVTENSTPREETGHQVRGNMEFILSGSSGHDGENSGEIDERTVTQNTRNASSEKTPRHVGTDQPSWDDRFADQDTDIVVELKDMHSQREDTSGGRRSSRSSSSKSKKVLPNTELQDLTKGLPQEGNAVLSTHSDSKPGQTTHRSDINHLTAESAFSETSSLPSNQVTNGVLPPEFEDTSSHNQYAAQGARPKLHNLLSNVELQSNSSLRPHSGTSHNSKTSAGSQNSGSQESQESKTISLNSGKNADTRSISEQTAVSEKCGHTNNSNVFNQPGIKTSAEPKGDLHKEVSTLDSTYVYRDPSSQPNTFVMLNGDFSSPEDSTTEASDPGREGINGNHTKDKFKSTIPNFFMSEKDMQASIKALKMATAAAKNEVSPLVMSAWLVGGKGY